MRGEADQAVNQNRQDSCGEQHQIKSIVTADASEAYPH